MKRRESREAAFMLVFQKYANDVEAEEALELAAESEIETDEFAEKLVELTLGNLGNIDALIAASLKTWTLERIPKIALAILRISCAQLKYMSDAVPDSVVINEAVELAKKYGDENDYSFVNGSLRHVSENLKAENAGV